MIPVFDRTLLRVQASQGLVVVSALLWAGAGSGPAWILGPWLLVLVLRPVSYPLRRWWSWAALPIFVLWWVVADGGERWMGFPRVLFFIPAWYFLLLAIVQMRSPQRGGSPAWAQGFSALALVLAGWVPGSVWYAHAALFALLLGVGLHLRLRWVHPPAHRPPSGLRSLGAWVTVVLITGSLLAAAHLGRGRLRSGGWESSSRWTPRDASLKGFGLQTFLGSFAENYDSRRDAEVVLRIWAQEAPDYLRGALYHKYRSGSWSVSADRKLLYPQGRVVEHSVYALDDPDTLPSPSGLILPASQWLDVYFVPPGTHRVAALPESLEVSSTGIFWGPAQHWKRGWYYFPPHPMAGASDLPSFEDREIPASLDSLLRTTWSEIRQGSTATSRHDVPATVGMLMRWFQHNFTYSLHPPHARGVDPIASFLKNRQGFCEHFASAGVLLLRYAGIPARFAKGFALDNRWAQGPPHLVRRGNAHAWVEAYLPPVGTDTHNASQVPLQWRVVDFTPALARPATPAIAFWRRWMENGTNAFARMRHLVRDGKWRDVADIMETRTTSLINQISGFDWLWLGLPMGLIWLGWRLRRRKGAQLSKTRWGVELRRVEETLAAAGIRRSPWEAVSQLLGRVPPGKFVQQKEFLQRYCAERFRAESVGPKRSRE